MNESRWWLESATPSQYMRNALYLNAGTDRFMEVAYLANLASTDWTWSVKFGDLDNDGWVDLFVTTGTANHALDPDLTRRSRDATRQQDRPGPRAPAGGPVRAFGWRFEGDVDALLAQVRGKPSEVAGKGVGCLRPRSAARHAVIDEILKGIE